MATATLLVIGGEMLDPARRDANGPLARRELELLGIETVLVARVEDKVESIREAFAAALALSDVVIASGGLGPTGDDLTREGAAKLLGRGIREDARWLSELEARLKERGRELTELGRRQALVVEGAEVLPNAAGLACGNWICDRGKAIALLPGVPKEFEAILHGSVIPRLAQMFPSKTTVRGIRAILAGIPEVEAEKTLRPWYSREGISVSILPALGILRVTFTLKSPPISDLDGVEIDVRAALQEGLGAHLVSLDGAEIERRIGELLMEKRWGLAVAESCTGGLLAQKIVSIPGASDYFAGSVTAYSNRAKSEILGVSAGLIEAHGAVSEDVAIEMCRGVASRFHTGCAMATTGVAGPTGGTPEKPVGTVWISAMTPACHVAHKLSFPADRATVMEYSANSALYMLWKLLDG